jgi:hypothetical protein
LSIRLVLQRKNGGLCGDSEFFSKFSLRLFAFGKCNAFFLQAG